MTARLFVPTPDGSFRSAIPEYRGLAETIEVLLGEQAELVEFGPTHADGSDEEFWRLMVRTGHQAELDAARAAARALLTAPQLSPEQLDALTKLCNAARLTKGYDPDELAYQLLTTVVHEASEAMLAAACER